MVVRLFLISQLCLIVTANLNDGPQRFCGPKLSNVLEAYCRGKFTSIINGKKRSGGNHGEFKFK